MFHRFHLPAAAAERLRETARAILRESRELQQSLGDVPGAAPGGRP